MKAQSFSFGDFAANVMRRVEPSNKRRDTAALVTAGKSRLAVAAEGLPISLAELEEIFRHDLEDFGSGAVSRQGIRQACEWYARGRPAPNGEEVPAGMVRCTDCQQDQCKHKRVTPWGSVERQSSPQWRWCGDYIPLAENIVHLKRSKP